MADRRLLALGLLAATAITVAGCANSTITIEHGSGSSAVHLSPAATRQATRQAAHEVAQTGGRVMAATIPGAASHFAARVAEVYLPPAAISDPHHQLPVIELLPGTTSQSSDWLVKGDLAGVMDSFAHAHSGQAPIVVMPDINGSKTADTECIRTSSGGNVEQYLYSVVPTWVKAHLAAASNSYHDWAVAGLSEGGTCSAMLALRHTRTYATFGDFSGLAHLTVGNTNNPPATIKQLFGGSVAAYDEHDPPYLLTHGARRSTPAAWFECGAQDTQVVKDQKQVAALARADGLTTESVMIPGKHQWSVWTDSLSHMLPWFWARVT